MSHRERTCWRMRRSEPSQAIETIEPIERCTGIRRWAPGHRRLAADVVADRRVGHRKRPSVLDGAAGPAVAARAGGSPRTDPGRAVPGVVGREGVAGQRQRAGVVDRAAVLAGQCVGGGDRQLRDGDAGAVAPIRSTRSPSARASIDVALGLAPVIVSDVVGPETFRSPVWMSSPPVGAVNRTYCPGPRTIVFAVASAAPQSPSPGGTSTAATASRSEHCPSPGAVRREGAGYRGSSVGTTTSLRSSPARNTVTTIRLPMPSVSNAAWRSATPKRR